MPAEQTLIVPLHEEKDDGVSQALLFGEYIHEFASDGIPFGICRVSLDRAHQACMDWHYSRKLPASAQVVGRYGVFVDSSLERYIGMVSFGTGARLAHMQFGVEHDEIMELTRIALDDHAMPVSAILKPVLDMVRRDFPRTRILVSYADDAQNHYGYVYQAMSWVYVARRDVRPYLRIDGRIVHPRNANARYGTSSVPGLRKLGMRVEEVQSGAKYQYVKGLDKPTRRAVARLALPYPKHS